MDHIDNLVTKIMKKIEIQGRIPCQIGCSPDIAQNSKNIKKLQKLRRRIFKKGNYITLDDVRGILEDTDYSTTELTSLEEVEKTIDIEVKPFEKRETTRKS